MVTNVSIGVLAIQGDFAAHLRMLQRIGVRATEIRRAADLEAVDGLIIPGGESTAILNFIQEDNLSESIADFADAGKPILGTCAGAILLAREVYNPAQPSLGLIDIAIERNAYGRQVDSFIAEIDTSLEGGPLEAVFIRAPKVSRVGSTVEVLATFDDEPVLVRDRNIIAGTFHPELTADDRIHKLFVEMALRHRESIRGSHSKNPSGCEQLGKDTEDCG